MTYLLVFVAVLLIGAVAFFLLGQRRRETGLSTATADPANPSLRSALLDDGLAAPVPNLPPVLLPEHPEPDDVDRVRFSLGLRGYRMDQVDQVLDQLAVELKDKDQQIIDLQTQLRSPLDSADPIDPVDSLSSEPQHQFASNDQPGSSELTGSFANIEVPRDEFSSKAAEVTEPQHRALQPEQGNETAAPRPAAEESA